LMQVNFLAKLFDYYTLSKLIIYLMYI